MGRKNKSPRVKKNSVLGIVGRKPKVKKGSVLWVVSGVK